MDRDAGRATTSSRDDATLTTANQLRDAVHRLFVTGQQHHTDPEVLVVLDADYDVTCMAWLLQDLPVILMARLRSVRVFYAPPVARRGPTGKGAVSFLGWPRT